MAVFFQVVEWVVVVMDWTMVLPDIKDQSCYCLQENDLTH